MTFTPLVSMRNGAVFWEGEGMSLPKEPISFVDYLTHEAAEGKTEFRIVIEDFGKIAGVKLYIHPLGKDGESRNFIVREHLIRDVTRWLPEPETT